jgi:catechol 2,3-dioxygenase-like lactoylglutathione lyase family enzyme
MIALADCAVAVSNANEAGRWWNEKLGFAVHTVGSGGHAVVVAPPGDRFILHLCEGLEPVEPGNTGIAFVTDDLEQLVLKMTASGVAFPEPLKKESWGGMAKFADPDGNVYWLLGAPTSFIRTEVARRAPLVPRPGRRPRPRTLRGGRRRTAR